MTSAAGQLPPGRYSLETGFINRNSPRSPRSARTENSGPRNFADLLDASKEMEKEKIIMKKVLALMMAVLMVAAMFAGCGSSNSAAETTAAAAAVDSTDAAAAGSTVKIGMSGPLTGGASAYGLAVKAGMEVAVEEINAKGGLQIEFNAQDDEADGERPFLPTTL